MHFLKNVPSTTSTSSAFYYDRAPDTTAKWVVFKRYLLNLEEKTACNRSATSWFLLLTFYISFLAVCWGLLVLMIFGGVTAIDYFGQGQMVDVASMKHPNH
ncbi:uncharacterized protein LOC135130838 [Zophobas morio]|uniref:uncharacterized protein LOC135130838 n=1 Tax=Zophobas morio TaxID=2755281 RepID=UPI003082B3AB